MQYRFKGMQDAVEEINSIKQMVQGKVDVH
jgi:hypothetical protein